MPTTAGSLALERAIAARDSTVVARLRTAGAIVLGKTNLSEWANIRSPRSTSGWSAVGGLTRNPHALDRNPSGSSSGAAAAIAANFATAGIGTETDGSIASPAAACGLVGLTPTVGLVSRDGIIPISHTQDTAGPMTRTVADCAARVWAWCARSALASRARRRCSRPRSTCCARGAQIVDGLRLPPMEAVFEHELIVLLTELKVELARYLAELAPGAPVQTLADIIAFNRRHAAREMPYFGQEFFKHAEATEGLQWPTYRSALATARRLMRDEGLDVLLREHGVEALVAPMQAPAWLTDLVHGDWPVPSFTTPAAVAGYPHLTVPMGAVAGLPVGLSFVGPAWSEARLLALGYAYEQASRARPTPAFARTAGTPSS
jgi:amidase